MEDAWRVLNLISSVKITKTFILDIQETRIPHGNLNVAKAIKGNTNKKIRNVFLANAIL